MSRALGVVCGAVADAALRARIKNLTANPLKYKPAVNQVELNFWNPQPELLAWARENGLLLEAYSPLGSNNQVEETLGFAAGRYFANEVFGGDSRVKGTKVITGMC